MVALKFSVAQIIIFGSCVFGDLKAQGDPVTDFLLPLQDVIGFNKEAIYSKTGREEDHFGGRSTNNSLSKRANTNVSPRRYYCGVQDEIDVGSNVTRKKRYSLQGSKWEKKVVTWAIVTPSSRSDVRNMARSEFAKAAELWSKATARLRFREVHHKDPNVDIEITFAVGRHGDAFKFDGRGGTLAHAFYPNSGRYSGDIHFDDTEPFSLHRDSDRSQAKISFFLSAAHELGHSLGLYHSNDGNALMAPFYQYFEGNFELPQDDKFAIQTLYGRPRVPDVTFPTFPPTTTETTTKIKNITRQTPFYTHHTFPPPVFTTTKPSYSSTTSKSRHTWRTPRPTTLPIATTERTHPSQRPTEIPPNDCHFQGDVNDVDLCDGNFDAVTHYRGEILLFKGETLFRVNEYTKEVIRDKLESFLGHLGHRGRLERIDAAAKIIWAVVGGSREGLVVFRNQRVFFFIPSNRSPIIRTLDEIGISNVSRVQAAWIWALNGYTYVSSGSLYWRLGQDGQVQVDYPRDASVWRGVPMQNVTGAFTLDSRTYFFAKKIFWVFDNQQMRLKNPAFMSAPFWLGCPRYKMDERTPPCSHVNAPKLDNTLFTLIIAFFVVDVYFEK